MCFPDVLVVVLIGAGFWRLAARLALEQRGC